MLFSQKLVFKPTHWITHSHTVAVNISLIQKHIRSDMTFDCFFFLFGISATFSCMLLFQVVKIQFQEYTHTHKHTTQKKQTAPAPRAMIDSIKSNSASVAHFKVNLSQHFDIFKNKACQVYFRSSFELVPRVKKGKMSLWPHSFSSDQYKGSLKDLCIF